MSVIEETLMVVSDPPCPRCLLWHAIVSEATWKRAHVVLDHADDMNIRGVDFQPGQRWTGKQRERKR